MNAVTMEQIANAITFVQSRVGASDYWFGADFETAVHGWLPKLGSRIVRNGDDPLNGYPTEAKAKNAARRYRDHCESWLKENHNAV